MQSTCLEKLIFKHVFSIRKTKETAKFIGLEPRGCKDINGTDAPDKPEKFLTNRPLACDLGCSLSFSRVILFVLSVSQLFFW